MRSRLLSMGLPVEDDRGARAESDRGEVKGTGGRSYVVRHMSKTGRRLGGSRQAQARTADGLQVEYAQGKHQHQRNARRSQAQRREPSYLTTHPHPPTNSHIGLRHSLRLGSELPSSRGAGAVQAQRYHHAGSQAKPNIQSSTAETCYRALPRPLSSIRSNAVVPPSLVLGPHGSWCCCCC
jgi:hypothetical protein